MHILITGSSGYIGRSFMSKFQNRYDINVFSLKTQVLNDITLNTTDVILHCAALVHQKNEKDYEEYYNINVRYPLDLAKIAKENGVKHFIFLSSVAVYGESKTLLLEDTKCNPVTSYGKSKLEAEEKLKLLEDENFIISIIRPPMVYGEEAPGNIQSLINLVQKISVLPFAKINNKRNFIYIGNLVYLINEVIKGKKSGVFLASDDQSISTTYLIELIAQALEQKIYLIKIPFFDTFLSIIKPTLHRRLFKNLEVDNTITKQTLNYKNPYSVEEGIKNMIQGEKHDTIL